MRPLDLPDFETKARGLRYKVLGAACRKREILDLLFAHHADDQAETALMRLASGHKGMMLRGMKAFLKIPECLYMYGVNSSGSTERAWRAHEGSSNPVSPRSPILFESGGVNVFRPLLEFSKQDLIGVCIAHGIAWVEDKTNKDVQRTPRNACRNLLENGRLPRALSRSSLLSVSTHMTIREMLHSRIASDLFKRCKLYRLDLRSGRVMIRLPTPNDTETIFQDYNGFDIFKTLVATLLVRKIANIVTPDNYITLSSLQDITIAMFPELVNQAGIDQVNQSKPETLSAAGIHFERAHLPIIDILDDTRMDIHSRAYRRQSLPLDLYPSWILSREQVRTALYEPPQWKSALPSTLRFSPWSHWLLWDGRFWIRVKHGSYPSLRLRLFRKADIQFIRSALPKTKLKRLEMALASAAPGFVRWTLPVIVDASTETEERPQPLALPTLGDVGYIDVGSKDGQKRKQIKWEVRYKNAELPLGYVGDGWTAAPKFIKSWIDSEDLGDESIRDTARSPPIRNVYE